MLPAGTGRRTGLIEPCGRLRDRAVGGKLPPAALLNHETVRMFMELDPWGS